MMKNGMAGFAYGLIEKSVGDKIPTLPMLGKAGTIAVAIHFLGKGNPTLQQAGEFAAGLAGYQLGKDGKIDGEDGVLAL